MFQSRATDRDSLLVRWFAPMEGGESYLRVRWLFLRGLALTFFSAFYALWFQIHGLVGPAGILPASQYLTILRQWDRVKAFWAAPTLLWLGASDAVLTAMVVAGLVASITLLLNLWPRLSIAVAAVCFLSFVAAAQDFSGFQSDGMLLEAAFLSLFFAPRGLLPGLGAAAPPSRAALFLLRWEWFRIFFESGLVKILSGEPQWRNFTAMDKYYENGPLPTWIAWHVQHFPHAFHAASVVFTLACELFVAWLVFFPGRWPRLVAFIVTSALQIGIILTANYAFLNYLVLVLGVLLLDDGLLGRREPAQASGSQKPSLIAAVVLPIHFVTTSLMFFYPMFPIARLLGPTRIVNNYGLFAVMTRSRYELEFQGTRDGRTWTPYPFRYKPQNVNAAPGIYAPYQPRFEWTLWFAALGSIGENTWVLNTEGRLVEGSPAVLHLFASDPFEGKPPVAVRTFQWQYRFSTAAEKAATGAWWVRAPVGVYAPVATRTAAGVSFGD